jgi:uncharacterized membrane protein YkvI
MKRIFILALSFAFTSALLAQGETAGGGLMRGHHKLPVVVGVIAIILAVIFTFLFGMERRLKKLEEKQQ